MELPSVDFFGLKISVFSRKELVQSIKITVTSDVSKVYYGYSLAVLSYLKKYPEYHNTTEKFDVMVTDGRMFYLIAKLFGHNLKFDISIPRLTVMALKIANKMKLKVFLLGGTEFSNKLASEKLKEKYLRAIICKGRNGYFECEEQELIIEQIKQESPNILLLGFPTPAKQFFAAQIRSQLKGCIIIPCGGMIDVLAGTEKLTPHWIKRIGLASLYRHLQHPKRLPELFKILILAVWVFGRCFFKKIFRPKSKISIPEMLKSA
jgi:N-acetylglucosaminyldiphosphoundecaprenol N-acetyl-beta-D-mannosaminyltransferase